MIAKKTITFGLWITGLFLGGFILWAVLAPLNSAAVAPGHVIFSHHTKTVQHLEGGIVKELLVQEGQKVTQHDPIIILDATPIKANLNILTQQYWAAKAKETRLILERELSTTFQYPDQKIPTQYRKIFETETLFFKTRTALFQSTIDVYTQKMNQLEKEISGLTAQLHAAQTQHTLIQKRLEKTEGLKSLGYASEQDIDELAAQAANIKGQIGALQAAIAKAEQQIVESKLEIIQFKSQTINTVVEELKSLQVELQDIQERLIATQDTLDRTIIRASQDGTIKGLMVHTIGGVVPPASPICEIVPDEGELVVEARVSPQDIDVIKPGIKAQIRLSAYRANTIPPIYGTVVYVSPDKFVDENTGPFFAARIKVNEEELDTYKDVELYPGMMADTYLITGSRTFFNYLLTPITEVMRKSFRDD